MQRELQLLLAQPQPHPAHRPALAFDFGPPLEEVLANCKAETGLEPPTPAKPLRWSPLQDGKEALRQVREHDNIPEPPGGVPAATG